MNLWWLYISVIWRFLVFFCIFYVIHSIRELSTLITSDNYFYWATPCLVWAEFGIQKLLKNREKIERLCMIRKTPYIVTVVNIINFIGVNIIAPIIAGKMVPLSFNVAFTIIIFHGEWGVFAMAAPDENPLQSEIELTRRCTTCGYFLKNSISDLKLCPMCSSPIPLSYRCFAVMFSQLIWAIILFLAITYPGKYYEKAISFIIDLGSNVYWNNFIEYADEIRNNFGEKQNSFKLDKITKTSFFLVMTPRFFVVYYFVRIFIAAATQVNNDRFLKTIGQYSWRLALALGISIALTIIVIT